MSLNLACTTSGRPLHRRGHPDPQYQREHGPCETWAAWEAFSAAACAARTSPAVPIPPTRKSSALADGFALQASDHDFAEIHCDLHNHAKFAGLKLDATFPRAWGPCGPHGWKLGLAERKPQLLAALARQWNTLNNSSRGSFTRIFDWNKLSSFSVAALQTSFAFFTH